MTKQTVKGTTLAMWSGPRNISTAMMRAWENRSDSSVWDEPFYAYYLAQTGFDHPMANEIVERYGDNLPEILSNLGVVPKTGLHYQKHISTHLLPHIPLDWISGLQHMFLIRHPEHMIASYAVKHHTVTARDLGLAELARIYQAVVDSGYKPLVIDSARFLTEPETHLRAMCAAINIEFEQSMLSWPAGPRDSDGLWHAHWYDSVKKSTGFGPPRTKVQSLNDKQKAVVEECMPYYNTLSEHALEV